MPNTTIYAIGYARVSTPKQAVEGDSLDLQAERITRSCIENNGWTLFPDNLVFQEPFTGTTDVRPVYELILRLIKSNPGKVRYFVVTGIDRFSREGSLKYQQMKQELTAHGVELRDLGGVIQPAINSLEHFGFTYEWSRKSPSALSELVLAETASHERSAILTRLVGAQIKLTQDGYHIGRPEDGYTVKRIALDGKKKCAQFADPHRAHFFREMFRLRAEGIYSDAEIVERINALGFSTLERNRWDEQRTRIVGRRPGIPLTVKQLQLIVRRVAYCGIICEKWTRQLPVRAKGGEPLVSIDTFNRANRGAVFVREDENGSLSLLYNCKPERLVARRQRFNKRFLYKNIAMCPTCGKPLLASFSRGKAGKYFGAYHCARKHVRRAVSKQNLETAFDSYLSRLKLTDCYLEGFARVLIDRLRLATIESREIAVRSKQSIGELNDKKAQLVDAFANATTSTMRADLERRAEEVDAKISALGPDHREFDITEDDIRDFLEHLRKVVEHPEELARNVANKKEQLAVFGLFFDALPTYEEIVNGTPQLSLTFALSCVAQNDESRMMNVPSLGWNTLEKEILKWKGAAYVIDIVSDRVKESEEVKNAA